MGSILEYSAYIARDIPHNKVSLIHPYTNGSNTPLHIFTTNIFSSDLFESYICAESHLIEFYKLIDLKPRKVN